jgi:hypothetical protein
MMPADLIYALSSNRQRALLNATRAGRIADQAQARALACERNEAADVARPVRVRRGWVRVRVRPTRECLS